MEDKVDAADINNKKPLVVITNVLASNTDTNVKTALQMQNGHILEYQGELGIEIFI